MEIQISNAAGVCIVAVTGSIDALTAGDLTSSLSAQVGNGQKNLVLDLSQVDFMSSAGLRAILAALKECRQVGGDLRIAAAQPGVNKVLNMSGFTSILKTYPDLPAALASFQ